MDKPKAVIVAAHKLTRLIDTMLTKGGEYTDKVRTTLRALSRASAAASGPARRKDVMKLVASEQAA